MNQLQWRKAVRAGLAVAGCLIVAGLVAAAQARAEDETNIHVVVKDAKSGDPIFQAHLTLQFREGGKLKRDKWISYSAKTDKQGKYVFRHINKGAIRLMVTAPEHQTFGKEYEIEKDNPVIEVSLRKPQPML
jgi:Carboxypeptidase regulatory-like domain